MFRNSRILSAVSFTTLLTAIAVPGNIATAQSNGPWVTGDTIHWPDDGWYHVESVDNGYAKVCEGTTSCTVSAGTYVVINHTTNLRWENIIVSGGGSSPTAIGGGVATAIGTAVTIIKDELYGDIEPVVFDDVIMWKSTGWVQVVSTQNYQTVCEGGDSCQVTPGWYMVINHQTGVRTTLEVKQPAFVTINAVIFGNVQYDSFDSIHGRTYMGASLAQLPPAFAAAQAKEADDGSSAAASSQPETVWSGFDPRDTTAEDATSGNGATAYEYEIVDGELGPIVTVVSNGIRYTPEEWEVERIKRRDHFVTSVPAGKVLTFFQNIFKLKRYLEKKRDAHVPSTGGDDDEPLELNGPANNWGWGNHPEGEFATTPPPSIDDDDDDDDDGSDDDDGFDSADGNYDYSDYDDSDDDDDDSDNDFGDDWNGF